MTGPVRSPVPRWRRVLRLGPAQRVDARTASAMQRDGALLVDVRERHEWAAGRAPRARHMPLADLERRRTELRAGVPVLTICRSGARSARAARTLRAAGVPAVDVRGGMLAWQSAGLPVVGAGGRLGRVQ